MSERVLRLRGIGLRLSIALFVVNLVALAIVYGGTVPSLGGRLVAAREAALLRDAQLPAKDLRERAAGSRFRQRCFGRE